MLFELYATGNYSITTLTNKIIKEGLISTNNKVLSRSMVEVILKNTFYYGIAYSKKYGSFPHKYPVLINKDLFDKCQEILIKRRKMPSKATSKREYT
jgi:hypothetical protein